MRGIHGEVKSLGPHHKGNNQWKREGRCCAASTKHKQGARSVELPLFRAAQKLPAHLLCVVFRI